MFILMYEKHYGLQKAGFTISLVLKNVIGHVEGNPNQPPHSPVITNT